MKAHPKVNPLTLVICPHCGNKTRHKLLHRQDFIVVIEEDMFDECWWAILECSTCGQLSLYRDYWDKSRQLWTSRLIYPVPIIAPTEAPENIQKLFQEAVLVKPFSPSLCVVGIRRCLEAICSDRGATGKTLSLSIKELTVKGILPERLAEMMDSSRIIGNLGAHAVSVEVTEDDADVLIDFCSAILEYVYVAPNKIASIQRRLDSLKGN
jgi:hypothetical protein